MKPKILIVDDEQFNLFTFQSFLASDGYEIHCADSGHKAVEMAEKLLPDLILLDVMMPEFDGFAVCRKIRSDPRIGRVPIVFVTAMHDATSRLEGLRAGADDFVTKPCSREEIRARVRTIVSLNRFRAIADQRVRFERLFEVAPIGIILTDERGLVLDANQRAETLLARADGPPLRGTILWQWVPDAVAAMQTVVATALAGRPVTPIELRLAPGAEQRVVSVQGMAVPEDGDRRAMLVFHDVTAEVQARETMERLNRDLDSLVQARTQQLQDANTLLLSYAGFVSHDLRSPLAVTKGYLSMIKEGVVPMANARPMIERAYDATLMMEELVHNILQLAHDEHKGTHQSRTEIINPEPVVKRVLLHVRALFPQLQPEVTIAPLPPVQASPLLVERVFYNLLSNALKYSAHRETPMVEIGAFRTADGTAYFVRDNGVGFDSRDADRLFQEFSRLDDAPPGDGFGLGLALVARLVKAHGGRMWAQGKSGVGATFYVQFEQTAPGQRVEDASPA